MRYPKDKKLNPIYTVDMFGEECEGPAKLPFYDVVQDRGYFIVRYYGCCAVETTKTLEEARDYIHRKAAHILERKEVKK